nr:MAG TPA: hypothetical protein [Caudoviricetes sp.]DAX20033.1 MAG TPA: hypothetical protein [Caudoviricetes sp.]DAY12315.1 MAG TPA: hypothetical protein [Caudoviricetes sp.]
MIIHGFLLTFSIVFETYLSQPHTLAVPTT